jgi:[protein-PII] uridylyltransferase
VALRREPLLANDELTGAMWCRAHSRLIDEWLASLLYDAVGDDASGLALVAVGGYGRSELCPQSDIDLMLLHDRPAEVASVADRIWYPIWDEGLHLGHTVRTIRQALDLGADDLDTATALLSARHVAGDEALTARLAEAARSAWEKRSKRWLTELGSSVELRHERAGEVTFHLEPDLKEGRGGLRDVHALWWAEAARWVLFEHDAQSLADAYAVLLDARVELQRRTGRPSNVLALQEQDSVASALGLADADVLMHRVADAARNIAWTSDDTWRRIRSALRGPLGRVSNRTRSLGGGIRLRDGEVHLEPGASAGEDPFLPLRTAVAAATHHTVIERASLERLAVDTVTPGEPWGPDGRALFVELLLTGSAAIRVIEALDQRGIWARLMPEWDAVRARPQRNPYHKYTVDRHLLETVARAAPLAGRTDRPDLLVIAALLHDLGKGGVGDHTDAGVAIAERVGQRMGFTPDDVATLRRLVQHHLLLPDVATRRDLDDPTIIERVAEAVGSASDLALLAALTEADSLATGYAAWSPWKAELVGQLVERVAQVLAGEEISTGVDELFPTTQQLEALAAGGRRIDHHEGVLTVMTDDRPGMFSRVAGVLALHGLDIVLAAAHSTDDGRALAEFRVNDPVRTETPWDRVVADLNRALDGRLALHARVGERARAYRHRRAPSAGLATAMVAFDDHASTDATVIDVQAPDGIGVLYRITRAMAELDLDIRSARVQTLGHHVIDSFYVRDGRGDKVTDTDARAEIERAILHGLAE